MTCEDCKFYEKECDVHFHQELMGRKRVLKICEIFYPKEPRFIEANILVNDLVEAEANGGMGSVVARTLIRYVKRSKTVDAVPVDDIKLHHILIDQNGIPEVKLQFGDRTLILRREGDPVDVREVVHSRFVNVADYGDDQGCFGYCERCGTIHHAQHSVALKAGHRWCRWCGAKMDGDGNC